jgi:hypothetical protein
VSGRDLALPQGVAAQEALKAQIEMQERLNPSKNEQFRLAALNFAIELAKKREQSSTASLLVRDAVEILHFIRTGNPNRGDGEGLSAAS